MQPGGKRHAETLLAGFIDWLCERQPTDPVELVGYERPAVGFSTETLLVDIRRAGVGRPDQPDERLVLKVAPAGPGIFPTYDFALQARVQQAVAGAGIPVPAPAQVEGDPRWVGAPFLVMPAVAGHVIAEVPVADPWLSEASPEANAVVHGHYLDTIADIHRIDWRADGLPEVVPARDNGAEIAYWRDYLDWYGDGAVLAPALVEALDWCEGHCPASPAAASLLWGDVRLGNMIFDEAHTPVAVLDWEMATIGAAEHDLAWTLALEAIQDELIGRRVPGFCDHDAAVARYEERLGRAVQHLAWYEVFAMVRSAAIMTRIAHLNELAGQPVLLPVADNPVLEILRRRVAVADGRT